LPYTEPFQRSPPHTHFISQVRKSTWVAVQHSSTAKIRN